MADAPEPEMGIDGAATLPGVRDWAHEEAAAWERRVWVTREELRELSRVPTGKVGVCVALTWGALVLVLQAAITLESAAFYVAAFVANGFLFLWLAYWEHEATHGLLTHDRRLNDLLADLLLAGPFGVSVAQHRWQHGRHHQAVNDPEVEVDHSAWICIRGRHLFLQAFLHMTAWHGLSTMWRYRRTGRDQKLAGLPPRSLASMLAFVLVNGALFLLCALQGHWYLYPLLWALPFFTITVAIMNLYNIVEHQDVDYVCDDGIVPMPPITRVVRAGLLERALIAPIGSYYHIEHHHFPGIPAFQLHRLRRLLEERGRFEEPDIVWTDGYLRSLWRMSRHRPHGKAHRGHVPVQPQAHRAEQDSV